MEGRGIIHSTATATADQPEDRISNLPDEIIHEIFGSLLSTKQPAQLAILSKRWTDLWRSYPVLEFYEHEWAEWPSKKEEDLNKFLSAAGKKFADLQHVAAVRIGLRRVEILDKLLASFPAEFTAQEIRFHIYDRVLPARLFHNDRFLSSLRVVRLIHCSFPSGSSVRFGTSLKVLHLEFVRFPDRNEEGDGILNRMIEGASTLETLTLSCIRGIQRFRIRNHPKLKTLKFLGFRGCDFEVSGTQSLEFLHFDCSIGKYQVSAAASSNVKVLHMQHTWKMTNEQLNKFISQFPRLESLKLMDLPTIPDKISVNNHKLLRVLWVTYHGLWPQVIEIDAPQLSNLVFHIENDTYFPDILINKADTCNETASKPAIQVSVRCELSNFTNWDELKQFLAELRHFRLTTEFTHYNQEDKTTRITDKGVMILLNQPEDDDTMKRLMNEDIQEHIQVLDR
ncbi:Putative F-box/LRR-repeat protein At5g38386 [Linum grandiflorum]